MPFAQVSGCGRKPGQVVVDLPGQPIAVPQRTRSAGETGDDPVAGPCLRVGSGQRQGLTDDHKKGTMTTMKIENILKNRGPRAEHDFVISSPDYDGMEAAYRTLPKRLRALQLGSGFSFVNGERDHHFVTKSFASAKTILQHYKIVLGKITVDDLGE